MEETNQENEDVVSLIKEYISTRIEIVRLSVIEGVSILLANLITLGFVFVCFALTFLFGSLALAFYLGDLLGSNALGFGSVTLLYLIIGLVIYFIKDGTIEKNLIDYFIRNISRNKK